MIANSIFQGIGQAVIDAEARERILSDWNFYPKQKRQAIYDRHYRLMVGMMDKYRLHTCWCLRAYKTETSREYCECGELL